MWYKIFLFNENISGIGRNWLKYSKRSVVSTSEVKKDWFQMLFLYCSHTSHGRIILSAARAGNTTASWTAAPRSAAPAVSTENASPLPPATANHPSTSTLNDSTPASPLFATLSASTAFAISTTSVNARTMRGVTTKRTARFATNTTTSHQI